MKIVPSHAQNDQGPVEQVSWDDAVTFCEKLSALPAERAAGRVYRLPTEAEWEYAARGGTTTKFSFGDDASVLGSYAWIEGNSQGQTHPVGLKKPNAWGLHDTHGNVFEWCSDWYGQYSVGSVVDPVGPSEGDAKIQRGGCFGNPAAICRVSLRRFGKPAASTDYVGFRVAMDLNSSGTPTKKSSRSETKPPKVSKKVSQKTPPPSSAIQNETTSHALPAPAENMTPSPNPEPGLVRESSCPGWGWKGFSDEEAAQYRADRRLASAG